ARAAVLMAFLNDHLFEKQLWPLRLRVLREIAKHTLDASKIDSFRDDLRDTILHVFSALPSLNTLLRHSACDDSKSPEQLSDALAQIEAWLHFDVGSMFYQQGSGPGKVTEINLKLRVIRLDFEKKKDITVQLGDQELLPLAEGHPLRKK